MMKQNLDLPTDLLRTFIAAADLESYTAAAGVVHRTQAAVSMQMKRLEENVGYPLFERNGHSMRLTFEGQKLSWYARRILNLHDEAQAALFCPDIAGRVRFGAPDDYAERILPDVLKRFYQTHPQVLVDVVCDSSLLLVERVNEGDLDIAVSMGGENPTRGRLIHREQAVWITSSCHLAYEQDPVPIAVYNGSCVYREWAIKTLDSVGKNYRIAYTSANTAAIFAAVKAGLAVAPASLSCIPSDVRMLTQAEGFPALPTAVVTIVKAGGAQSPAIEAFAEYIVQIFTELSTVSARSPQLKIVK